MRYSSHIMALAAMTGLMAGNPAFAAVNSFDDGSFTITATNGQLTSAYAGATTFTDPNTTFAGYTGSVTTPVATITGGSLNAGTNPDSGIDNSISNYLAGGTSGTVTIAFNANQQYFGMAWGSVDAGNTVNFYEGATLIASYTGSTLNNTVGLQYYPAVASYVDFVADGSAQYFNTVTLTGSDDPFETANYASVAATSAVPEASTWAMMLMGFVGLGFAGLRSRKAAVAAAA